MKADELRKKDHKQLQDELLGLLRQKFTINVHRGPGNKKAIKRDIARVKTVITEKQQDK
jgi:large subunit ribosomal protein L29